MADLCRNKKHPRSERYVGPDGKKSYCYPCKSESAKALLIARPGGRDGWTDPVADAERRGRLAAWMAGVDDAIARIRAEEGFDGTRRGWQTLGECLRDRAGEGGLVTDTLTRRRGGGNHRASRTLALLVQPNPPWPRIVSFAPADQQWQYCERCGRTFTPTSTAQQTCNLWCASGGRGAT